MIKPTLGYRQAIADYIRLNAQPPDKFSHQPRLYRLACQLGQGETFDDDVVYAAAWMHDLGVFIGHRPAEPAALAAWNNVAYVLRVAPRLLKRFGFPEQKVSTVLEVIRTHQPTSEPTCFEGVLLRDADILEQIGAVGILRTVSKVGRDTRFVRFADALQVLRRNLAELPGKLKLDSARQLAGPRVAALQSFLEAAQAEATEEEF